MRGGDGSAGAVSLESNEGVYFVPALAGLGAPHWDAYARGTIIGLTRGTTRAHLARAALESMCYQTRDVVEAMERDSGVRLRESCAPTAARSPTASSCSFRRTSSASRSRSPSITETTASARPISPASPSASGKTGEELDAKWRVARRYEPRMSEAERERLHSRWLRAVERARIGNATRGSTGGQDCRIGLKI